MCPSGWRKFALSFPHGFDFDKHYGDWPIAYLGMTRFDYEMMISFRGSFTAVESDSQSGISGPGVFLAPNIDFASRDSIPTRLTRMPRHFIQELTGENFKFLHRNRDKYCRIAYQVRVKPGTSRISNI